MSDAENTYDEVYIKTLEKVSEIAIHTDQATTAMTNLRVLSDCRPPTSDEPETKPEPETVMGKLKASLNGVWDNETTRVLIKAGGAFAGVALVTWTTVHRDHVVTREALSQANQRIS